jgi:hypothetical protein
MTTNPEEMNENPMEMDFGFPRKPQFYNVSVVKFCLMSFFSMGFYYIWWVYNCWCYVNEEQGESNFPIVRTAFDLLFFIPLYNRIFEGKQKTQGYLIFLLYACYSLCMMHLVVSQEFDKVGYFLAKFSFLFYVPMVFEVNRMNLGNPLALEHYGNFGLPHRIIIIFSVYVYLIVLTNPEIRNNVVLAAKDLSQEQLLVLEDLARLKNDDSILFAYSPVANFKVEGCMVTQNKVVSYYFSHKNQKRVLKEMLYEKMISVEESSLGGSDLRLFLNHSDGSRLACDISSKKDKHKPVLQKLNDELKKRETQ